MDSAEADARAWWSQGEERLTRLLVCYNEERAVWEARCVEWQTVVDDLKAEKRDLLERLAAAEATIARLEEEAREFKSVSRIVAISNENRKLKETIQIMERSLGMRAAQAAVAKGASSSPAPVVNNTAAAVAPVPETQAEEASEAQAETQVEENATEAQAEDTAAEAQADDNEASAQAEDTSEAPAEDNDASAQAEDTSEAPAEDNEASAQADDNNASAQAEDNEAEAAAESTYYEIEIKGVAYYMNDAEEVFAITEDGDVGEPVGYYTTVKGKKKFLRYKA